MASNVTLYDEFSKNKPEYADLICNVCTSYVFDIFVVLVTSIALSKSKLEYVNVGGTVSFFPKYVKMKISFVIFS